MPEVRLIDMTAITEQLRVIEQNGKLTDAQKFRLAEFVVVSAPTIEPEVRHGRWLSFTGTHYTGREDEYGDPEYKEHVFFVCSNCRRKTVVRENFCPRCGWMMTGGAGE